MAIVTRSGKGSALTYAELDNNFTELANATNNLNQIVTNSATNGVASAGIGIQLNIADTNTQTDASIVLDKFVGGTATPSPVLTNVDLSVNAVAASGSGDLSYSSANKQFTFTPPDLTSFLTSSSSIGSAQLPAIAVTSVQTAADQAAQLALTTQEGDVVVRTDESKSYVRNNGTADPHDMTNFTLLQTPDADTTYGMTISQTGSGTDAVLNDNPILKLDPSNGTDIDITLTGGVNTTVTRVSDTEVSIASTDTWQANAVGVDGYVEGPVNDATGQNKVWKTDGSGVPAWRDDLDTTLSTGNSTAIQKGDGNGGLTDASAGTDYSTLAIGTSNTTALAGDTVVDNLLLEIPKSGGTLNDGDKSWLKVATVTMDARYEYYSAQLAVVGTGAVEGVANEKILAIRVKQQAQMGQAPLVDIDIYNNGNEDYDFGHVVAVNSGTETRVDIYFRPDGPNSGAEVYKMADTATATVAWSHTGNSYATSAPANFVQGGAHQQWHSGNQAGIFGSTNGILKANGSGVLSAAVAGTDYDSRYNKGSVLTLPTGDNSISSGFKSIKILTVDLDAVGEHYRAVLKVNEINGSTVDTDSNSNHVTVDLVFAQDQAFGNNPSDNISITSTANTSDDATISFNSKHTQNNPTTVVDVYAKVVRGRGAVIFLESETLSDSSNVTRAWNTSLAVTDYINDTAYNALTGGGTFGDYKTIHTTESAEWDILFGTTAGIAVTDGNATKSAISVIGNGTGFLKNDGNGTYSYDSTTYSTLALGTTSTTALAGDTALLQLGTTSTTALAGNTALLQLGTTSTTALAGNTALLQLGTSGTTALAGNTALLQIGTSGTTAMAGNTALSAIGGSLDLSSQVTGTLPVGNMAATALTTVQTAANQAAQLALTTQEGDVVVRTDENKTYMRNSGTADPHDMTNFTLLATPTDAVTSVDGNTGVVTTLQLGTTSTTALAGNTSLLQLGTTSTTALAGNTALLQLGTTSTTALAGDTALLQLGTTSTTALAGDTALLQLGTSSTTALAGDTALLQLGTSSTTALAGDTALLALGTSSTTALAGDTALLALGTSSTTALAGNTTFSTLANSSTATDTITIGASAQSGAIAIGNSSAAQTINIAGGSTGGGTTNTVNIASAGGTGSTKNVNIARMSTTGVTTNILMGNTSSSATSNITLTGNTTINNALGSNTITIGGTNQTGAITLGNSTQTQTINIGAGNVAGSRTKTINIGTGNSSGSTTNINIGPSNSTATRAIDINGSLTVDGTAQFDHMVTLKSDASSSGVYDQLVSIQAKGGTTVWYEAARIATLGSGSAPSRMIIGQDNAAMTFFDGFGSRYIYPAHADTGAGTNGVCDLGSFSSRWKLGRFSSGTTTSSDRNEKRDIEELTAAELRVAVRCKPLLRKYRRIDAYEEKGEAARIHFGIIAQDLDDAFTAEGLDAHRYAMFMEDTWYEYEGGVVSYPTLEDIPEEHRASATEHTAMGVRYEQLLAFMIAAL